LISHKEASNETGRLLLAAKAPDQRRVGRIVGAEMEVYASPGAAVPGDEVSIDAGPGVTIARSTVGGLRAGPLRRPCANRDAVKRQGGTCAGQPEAPGPGILDEKLVGKGRTR
jgi:hypothetical protein